MAESKVTINKIRSLLDELERTSEGDDQAVFSKNFDALEIPDLIASIVDYLQPLLHPYESAIYWHLFRKCIIATGQQYCRASTKG